MISVIEKKDKNKEVKSLLASIIKKEPTYLKTHYFEDTSNEVSNYTDYELDSMLSRFNSILLIYSKGLRPSIVKRSEQGSKIINLYVSVLENNGEPYHMSPEEHDYFSRSLQRVLVEKNNYFVILTINDDLRYKDECMENYWISSMIQYVLPEGTFLESGVVYSDISKYELYNDRKDELNIEIMDSLYEAYKRGTIILDQHIDKGFIESWHLRKGRECGNGRFIYYPDWVNNAITSSRTNFLLRMKVDNRVSLFVKNDVSKRLAIAKSLADIKFSYFDDTIIADVDSYDDMVRLIDTVNFEPSYPAESHNLINNDSLVYIANGSYISSSLEF